MAIKAVVFDIGGILEVIPEGGDPTSRFPLMLARWEQRLSMAPGALTEAISALDARLQSAGKDGALGTCSYDEWVGEFRAVTGWDAATMDAFMEEHWETYIGEPNPELAAYFADLRPRYRTAFLSNSFVGAREREQAARAFEDMADLIVYSHEVGVAKPDSRIYALTCERLGVHPAEMIFLDDALPNIAAARDFGIHAILFQDNAQAIREIEALLATHGA
ncbi:MAG TPA: HAD family phosphatase [Ktedonobacterales bacterium]|nr:HAD family phosphatase [Ktedonobacterales bacterium]